MASRRFHRVRYKEIQLALVFANKPFEYVVVDGNGSNQRARIGMSEDVVYVYIFFSIEIGARALRMRAVFSSC